jgi:uncharacterized protein (TIGR03000 family)
MTTAVVPLAAVAALAAWGGTALADSYGPYDNDGGRYYADEARDYRAMGFDAGGTGLAQGVQPYYFAGTTYSPDYRYAAVASDYYYGAPAYALMPRADYAYGAYAQAQPRDNAARIRLIVPAEARVWFDNKLTRQTGSERRFESPALTPGRDYSYDLKALWRDANGKEVTQTRHVDVAANANVTVDFTR